MTSSKTNVLNSEEPSSNMIFWLILIGILSIGGGLYYAGDKLGASVSIPLAMGACLGFRSGAWKMLSMLVGSAGGYYFAKPTSEYLLPLIENTFNRSFSNSWLGTGISGVVAGSVVVLCMMVTGWVVIYRIPFLKSLDQNLGMFVGTVKAFGLVAVGIWTVLAMEPRMIKMQGTHQAGSQSSNTTLFHRFLSVAEGARKSPVLSYLVKWNPVAQHPMLNDFIDKTQAMVVDLQTQAAAAQSGKMPSKSKLTGLFSDAFEGP